MSTPADRHAQIIDAAIKLFRKKSYHGTSMQDIADVVGLNRGSLYHYINSKEEVLFFILDRAVSRFNEDIIKIQAEDISATEKLQKTIYYQIQHLAKHQEEHCIMAEDSKHLSQEYQEKIRNVQKQYEGIFRNIIEEGIQNGEFKEMHPKVTFAILGMMNWIYRWYSVNGELSPDEIAVLFEDIVLNGISKK